VLANLVHFLFALPILALALLGGRLLGHEVGGWTALLLPAVLLLQLPMVSGLSLALGALNAHFKDVRDIVTNLLTLLFFLTPIIYPLEQVRESWWPFLYANPFTAFSLAYQQVLYHGTVPSWGLWLAMGITGALFWLAGSWLFGRLRETLVEAV
jgi:ABC-type polysaccharide/polyol phosphate export permease